MTRIGRRITEAIEEKAAQRKGPYFKRWGEGYNIRRLSLKLDVTSEHTRRYVRSLAIPDDYQLNLICKELDIPYQEAAQLVALDRMQEAMKRSPFTRDEQLQVFCMLWPRLSKSQQEHLLMVEHGMLHSRTMAAAG